MHVRTHICGHTAQRGWPLSVRTPHAKLRLSQQMLLAAAGQAGRGQRVWIWEAELLNAQGCGT